MAMTNRVVWRALERMMRDKKMSDACIMGACGLDVAQLRATRGMTPEIMASDMYYILSTARVSWDDFSRYFPARLGVR